MRKVSNFVLGFASLGFVVSLVANWLLYRQGNGYYLQLNDTRLDPLGLSAFPVATPTRRAETDLVVFFGDSRAATWDAPVLDRLQVVNRGIGSQTSAQVAARFDQHIAPLQPDVLVVQVGINDLKTIPLFPEKETWIIETCQANIAAITQRALANGTQKVILTTIFPLGKLPLERRLVWSPRVAAAIAQVNAFIMSLAAVQANGQQVIVFDTAAVLAQSNGVVAPQYSQDFLHLNANGYAALNQALVPLLAPQ